ncbi:hypothetical protein C8R43DRAFT_982108 [Mycena crocata]|nr:hypothetical protein C8R43DRAFT_982108 [Mycena crocata]
MSTTFTMTQTQVPVHKARTRALSLALVAASRTAPLLDIPTELGLEILELALTQTPFSTLAVVSKAFSSLISSILYRHVVLDHVETMSLFYRTVKSKTPDFFETHIRTLAVTVEPWRSSSGTRTQLEGIIAVCTGLRALSITRPGILAVPLSRPTPHRALPSEVTIQSFDDTTSLEWNTPSTRAAYAPAGYLSTALTHLKISEPGDTWHSPLSILAFFGSAPQLTHLALARRMDANTDNDQVFVDEICTLLASRPKLKMLVVRIFPSQWPRYFDHMLSAASSSIWAAVSIVAEADRRVVLVAAGWDDEKSAASWAHSPTAAGSRGFWEQSKME